MSFSFLDDNELLLPNILFIANAARQRAGYSVNEPTTGSDNGIHSDITNEFEQRLHDLLLQRTQLLNPIETNITPIELRDIESNKIMEFCIDYKKNKRKLDEVSDALNKIKDSKTKIDNAYRCITDSLMVMYDFVKDGSKDLYKDLVNNTGILQTKAKEVVCKNEPMLLDEQVKLCNYISECVNLFHLVEKEVIVKEKSGEDVVPSIQCPICYDKNVDHVYVPCGHTICGGCSKKVISNSCIICRKRAHAMPFFLSA